MNYLENEVQRAVLKVRSDLAATYLDYAEQAQRQHKYFEAEVWKRAADLAAHDARFATPQVIPL